MDKYYSKISRILLIIIILGLAYTLGKWAIQIKTNSNTIRKQDKIKAPVSVKNEQPEKKPSFNDTIEVYRKQKEQEIALVESSVYSLPNIIRWNDYLIYENKDKNVILENTNNFEEKVLIAKDFLENIDTNGKGINLAVSAYISDFKIIDDVLYVSYGGYLIEGAIFWIDLYNIKEPQILRRGPNPHIVKFGKDYWVREGEGDACWGFARFTPVNLNEKSLGSTLEVTSGCTEGEYLLGWDTKTEAFITTNYTREDPYFGSTTYLALNKLESDGTRTTLINIDSNLGAKIKDVILSKTESKVYLSDAQSLYMYNIPTSQLSKIGDYEDKAKELQFIKVLEEGGICVRTNDTAPNKLIDHTTAKFIPDTTKRCNDGENLYGKDRYVKENVDFLQILSDLENYNYRIK
ncbi:MAG: hypothetical protein ACOZAO_05050 [Patescibacteria group bacterium]